MEGFNALQLVVLLLIVLSLVGQHYAIKKSKLIPVNYNKKQRLAAAAIASAPIWVFAVITGNPAFFALGLGIAAACYMRKTWYQFNNG